MSVFLMGVHDKSCDKFRTVAKCGNGHDDPTLTKLQKELDMVKISKVGMYGMVWACVGGIYYKHVLISQDTSKVPSWLLVNKTLVPDFVVRDPKVISISEGGRAAYSPPPAPPSSEDPPLSCPRPPSCEDPLPYF